MKDYYKLIKIFFKQPRKTILNNLASSGKNKEEIIKILEELKINPADRPQNLSVEQIKKLIKAGNLDDDENKNGVGIPYFLFVLITYFREDPIPRMKSIMLSVLSFALLQ